VKSLRLKIFLTMGLLVVAAIALLGVLSRGVTRTGLDQIVELEEARGQEADQALAETVRRDLEEARRRDGDFRSAEEILDGFARTTADLPRVPGLALFDARARLVVGRGMPSDRVDATPLDGPEAGMIEARWTVGGGERLETLVLRGGLPIRGGEGRQVGTLLTIPSPAGEHGADRHAALVRVDRRLLAAAAGVAILALLLGSLLARRIVRPVEDLAAAARGLGGGDLSRRVRVRSRDELGRLGRAFNQMAAALERAEDLRRQMVADVAHELRTPLAALRAQLEALQDGLLAATPETVASLVDDAGHLGRLVDDLQDLALADAGRLTLDRQPLDLGDEVRAAARSLGLELGAGAGAGLEIDLTRGLPRIDADPRRLRQILHNLLDNARLHGASGTPERPIRIAAREVDPERHGQGRHDQGGKRVRLTVRDHGPGIPQQDLSRIAERFYRADPSRGRKTAGPAEPAEPAGPAGSGRPGARGGAGLGLAIARALIELHGGTLQVSNADGGGIEVAVTLPAALAQAARPA